ncbi:hypothetical protein LCGC14_1733500 [marine sediment metagenome]|uniref:Uncharacterized protein n=1 Tax=marine sediment metagenome TaxID=412755 RepID=A0A0F9H8U4_9ZZZZ
MGRECVICHGASHGFTVGIDEEGARVTVHASSCAAILSERRQAVAQTKAVRRRDGKEVVRKTAGISTWTAEWEYGRYGPQHKVPCQCPKHRKESAGGSDADISWDRVIAGDPDIEYQ